MAPAGSSDGRVTGANCVCARLWNAPADLGACGAILARPAALRPTQSPLRIRRDARLADQLLLLPVSQRQSSSRWPVSSCHVGCSQIRDGVRLRHVICARLLEEQSAVTVPEIAAMVEAFGLSIPGRSGKVMSDALRWEVRKGRVVRLERPLSNRLDAEVHRVVDPQAGGRVPRSCRSDTGRRVIISPRRPVPLRHLLPAR